MIKHLIVLACLSGCATVKPTASLEANYAFPSATDPLQNSDRSYQCEQPQIRIEVGGETKGGWEFGVYHESMLLCGTVNDKPELFENGAYAKKKWGGWW